MHYPHFLEDLLRTLLRALYRLRTTQNLRKSFVQRTLSLKTQTMKWQTAMSLKYY
jgi:hypothetical protein